MFSLTKLKSSPVRTFYTNGLVIYFSGCAGFSSFIFGRLKILESSAVFNRGFPK